MLGKLPRFLRGAKKWEEALFCSDVYVFLQANLN